MKSSNSLSHNSISISSVHRFRDSMGNFNTVTTDLSSSSNLWWHLSRKRNYYDPRFIDYAQSLFSHCESWLDTCDHIAGVPHPQVAKTTSISWHRQYGESPIWMHLSVLISLAVPSRPLGQYCEGLEQSQKTGRQISLSF
jgi:hypothetical protein